MEDQAEVPEHEPDGFEGLDGAEVVDVTGAEEEEVVGLMSSLCVEVEVIVAVVTEVVVTTVTECLTPVDVDVAADLVETVELVLTLELAGPTGIPPLPAIAANALPTPLIKLVVMLFSYSQNMVPAAHPFSPASAMHVASVEKETKPLSAWYASAGLPITILDMGTPATELISRTEDLGKTEEDLEIRPSQVVYSVSLWVG